MLALYVIFALYAIILLMLIQQETKGWRTPKLTPAQQEYVRQAKTARKNLSYLTIQAMENTLGLPGGTPETADAVAQAARRYRDRVLVTQHGLRMDDAGRQKRWESMRDDESWWQEFRLPSESPEADGTSVPDEHGGCRCWRGYRCLACRGRLGLLPGRPFGLPGARHSACFYPA